MRSKYSEGKSTCTFEGYNAGVTVEQSLLSDELLDVLLILFQIVKRGLFQNVLFVGVFVLQEHYVPFGELFEDVEAVH